MSNSNEIRIFKSKEFGEVRVVIVNAKEYFFGVDIATSLGYERPSKAVSDHCKGILIQDTFKNSGGYAEKLIPEGDIYRLVMKSKLPSAERFELWVFDEVLPTIRKTGGYVNNDDIFIETYLPFADSQTRILFKTTLETVRKQNDIIQKQKEEIEHKEDVIIGLVDEITIAEKRQILNRVMRHNHANYQLRWQMLYREFDNKYHINSQARMNTYNETHKPKCKNRLDYIDNVMNKIPELYELAAKLFENDVKELVDQMYMAISI